MDWFSVSVYCNALMADLASDVLTTVGASGVLVSDKAGEKAALGTIQEGAETVTIPDNLSSSRPVGVTGYFSELQHAEDVIVHKVHELMEKRVKSLASEGIDTGPYSVATAKHKEEDWESAWKAGFKMLRVGKRLLVAPPWDLPQTVDEGEAVLVIDPGMAFGTGTHPTTRMCLAMLERFVSAGSVVADVGTGSGILAIAAVKLGAGHVYGWDFDPVAIHSAQKNAEANNVEDKLSLFVHESKAGDESEPPLASSIRCDLVVANIAADTLIRIADMIKSTLKPGGLAVLSGIISEKERRCTNAFRARGFKLVDRMREGEWVALCLKIGEH